ERCIATGPATGFPTSRCVISPLAWLRPARPLSRPTWDGGV
ncbi:uncharacterized protein METZ01_LOCUS60503, partial [marine metagenome]